jgi:hypothetical protein
VVSPNNCRLEFAGCVAVISHDRWFLDRIATHILACEGDSKWTFFDGNYQEYEADKRKRLGDNQRLADVVWQPSRMASSSIRVRVGVFFAGRE